MSPTATGESADTAGGTTRLVASVPSAMASVMTGEDGGRMAGGEGLWLWVALSCGGEATSATALAAALVAAFKEAGGDDILTKLFL